MGFLGIRHDPAWGGSGLDYWYVVAYAEELVRARNGGLGTGMLVQGEMATPIIGELGTDEQKREFLAPALRGAPPCAGNAICDPGDQPGAEPVLGAGAGCTGEQTAQLWNQCPSGAVCWRRCRCVGAGGWSRRLQSDRCCF